MKKKMKKKLWKKAFVATLTGGIALSIAPSSNVFQIGAKEKMEGITQEKIDTANNAYNDVKTKIEFLTMSDTEFLSRGENAEEAKQNCYEAQNYLYQRIRNWADNKNFQIDAIMNNGDVLGGNDPGSEQVYAQGSYAAFAQVFTENFGDSDPVVMLGNGNHDFSDIMGDVLDEELNNDADWYYGDKNSNYVGNYHVKVNGYDFITLDFNGENTFGYGYSGTPYKDFLNKVLEEIKSTDDYDSTKPIFIQAHSGYAGTTLGGQWTENYDTMGQDLRDCLKDFPQAILFSAHTHYPVEEETSIYQSDVTYVENGSMNYIYKPVPQDFIEGGYVDSGNSEIPEKTCNFISVLEDGRTVIRRFDVSNQRWIGMPWVVDTSKGRDGFTYTDENRSKISPWFDDSAQIHTDNITETSLTFGFDQAEDDELVNHYKISIMDRFTQEPASFKVKQIPVKGTAAEKSVTGTFRSLSRYYYRPNTMQYEISGLETGRVYDVEITAIDDFGNESQVPLTGQFMTAGEMSFPEIEGGLTLPENINEGKFFEMNFEDNLQEDIADSITATANGNVNYVDSYRSDFGKAVSIGNGPGNYIDLGNREEWNLGTDKNLTINFWTKVNETGGYGSIISNKNWTNWWRSGINIAPENGNTEKIEFTLGDDSGANGGVYATGQVPNYQGSWHMMTFTVDRENQVARTYMDGVLYAETSIENVGDMTSGLNMLLGVDGGKAYGNISFDMDELVMWNRALSEEDIKAYFNVTNDNSAILEEAIYYAEICLQNIKQNENFQVYDEVLTRNLEEAIEAAKTAEDSDILNAYTRLKECVTAVEQQPVRYAVNVSVENGTLSPANMIVNEGENAIFTLVPEAGYQIDGSNITTDQNSSYRVENDKLIIENITSSTQIHIVFNKQEQIDNGSNDENGNNNIDNGNSGNDSQNSNINNVEDTEKNNGDETKEISEEKDEIPDTGERMNSVLWGILLGVFGGSAAVVEWKKRKKA